MSALPARFWAKVEKTDTCWLWTAAVTRPGQSTGGYGVFGVSGRMRVAHRLAYVDLIGPIPEGLELDHLCRVRNCVNPDHLEAVTHKVNMSRGSHATKTECKSGHPLTGSNVYYRASGARNCKACRNQWQREHHARKQAAA